MNAAKVTLTSTILAAALGLVLGLATPSVQAHHDPDHNKGGGGGNPNSESNDKVFPVKVTFDDMDGDNIVSDCGDGDCPYVNGLDHVSAKIPMDGSPPGQLLVDLGGKEPRTIFIDFGAAEDCTGAAGGTLGCVFDNSDTPVLVQCPFPLGEREDADGTAADDLCSGLRQVTMNFRHAFVVDAEVYMLGMPNVGMFDGEASLQSDYEIGFRAEKNVGGWRLRFDPMCLGLFAGTGQFLEITATDNDIGDELPNDEWQIGTASGTKTACLTKTVKGNPPEELIGLFDMQFSYTVCILADPDVNNDCL